MQNYQIFERQINELLIEVKSDLPEEDMKNIIEFIEHNELGLAYETLCTQIYEYGVKITSDFYTKISYLGELIGIDPSEWLFLKELINDHES